MGDRKINRLREGKHCVDESELAEIRVNPQV